MSAVLQPLANVEDADIFTDWPSEDGDAIVVAEAKPSYVPSSYKKTVVGLLAKQENEPAVARTFRLGVAGYLVKPIDEKSLVPSIELAVARSKDMRKLRKDMEKVSERLENRSIIEKAKGLVMTQEGMTEQDAYDYIRKLSQTKNLSMRRVSEIILLKSGG